MQIQRVNAPRGARSYGKANKRAGYEVATAANAARALELLRRVPAEVAGADAVLPKPFETAVLLETLRHGA